MCVNMTRNEYKKLKGFPKDRLIDIIKEEDRLIKVISECCVDADKDGNCEYAVYKIKTYLCDIYNPINCAVEAYADALKEDYNACPLKIWPFLSKLAELWELKPDYRFWQLLQSIPLDRDPFFLEEAETEAILDKEIAEAKAWQNL